MDGWSEGVGWNFSWNNVMDGWSEGVGWNKNVAVVGIVRKG